MKITIAQLNPIVGDVKGNLEKIKLTVKEASGETDLVVFSELFLVGYPPRDLLDRRGLSSEVKEALDELLAFTKEYADVAILVGMPVDATENDGRKLYNSAVLMENGEVIARHHKSLLPAYDVFDETRYFDPATSIEVIPFRGEKLGVTICEDMWNDPMLITDRVYDVDPMEELEKQGATILINLSASPFFAGKQDMRYNLVKSHAVKYGIPFVFVNQVGGNDELVFDGRSMCLDGEGKCITIFPSFCEHTQTVDVTKAGGSDGYTPQEDIASVHDALVLGVKDYVKKCGFKKAIVGLSGGIDSAVVAAVAKEAVGSENVLGLTMPSEYSHTTSSLLAEELAINLGVKFETVPISKIYSSFKESLSEGLKLEQETEVGIELQNIQARIRGAILMAYSNKYGHLLLTTGNKSELAVGYCTLYGDMAGGLAVVSDLPKTMVYDLARYINKEKEIIPVDIIERAPSAELKPDQLDEDTLPPYEVLDEIVYHYVDEGCSPKDLIDEGFDSDVVNWVVKSVKYNEYKRRQAPPGLKVTTKAFGMGRRMPIAAKYDI